MRSAFAEHKVDQALEKIRDVLGHPSGGFGAPSWAESNGKELVDALEQLQERMRAHHMNLQQGAFPLAIYTARELKKYLGGGRSDIANRDAAEVFYRCLVNLVEELRPMDRKVAEQEAA